MALRQITEARQLSASHPRSAPQWAEGLVGTEPSCLFCVLTSGKPGLPTLPKHHATYRRHATCPLQDRGEQGERVKPKCLKLELVCCIQRWVVIKYINSSRVL